MSIAKKMVEAPAGKKVMETHDGQTQSRRWRAMLRTPWPWPRAVLAIFLLSLLLWGGVVAIISLAFD